MRPGDLATVMDVAAVVHPDFPEAVEVFAERLLLYPAGCRVLMDGDGVAGYAVSHPWRFGSPPKLDCCLGALPADPDLYYLHDVALLPRQRGLGCGAVVVADLVRVAIGAGLPAMGLVAVHGSGPFWQRYGFAVVDDPGIRAALASYGAAAAFMLRRLSPLPASTS